MSQLPPEKFVVNISVFNSLANKYLKKTLLNKSMNENCQFLFSHTCKPCGAYSLLETYMDFFNNQTPTAIYEETDDYGKKIYLEAGKTFLASVPEYVLNYILTVGFYKFFEIETRVLKCEELQHSPQLINEGSFISPYLMFMEIKEHPTISSQSLQVSPDKFIVDMPVFQALANKNLADELAVNDSFIELLGFLFSRKCKQYQAWSLLSTYVYYFEYYAMYYINPTWAEISGELEIGKTILASVPKYVREYIMRVGFYEFFEIEKRVLKCEELGTMSYFGYNQDNDVVSIRMATINKHITAST